MYVTFSKIFIYFLMREKCLFDVNIRLMLLRLGIFFGLFSCLLTSVVDRLFEKIMPNFFSRKYCRHFEINLCCMHSLANKIKREKKKRVNRNQKQIDPIDQSDCIDLLF